MGCWGKCGDGSMVQLILKIKSSFRILLVGIFLIVGLPVQNSVFSATVGDRLIIELNQYGFTQRQMEVYLLFRSVLSPGGVSKPWLVGENNWQESVQEFRNDMMIFLETRRLGRFQPQNLRIQQANQKALAAADKDAAITGAFKRLGIDRWTSLRTIVKVMQVDEYRRLKDSSGDKSWLYEIEKKYVVRRFNGTGQWLPIQPTLGRKPSAIE